jgi:hypothetical protein
MPSSLALPPVDHCRGTSPSQAANSRPFLKAAPFPMADHLGEFVVAGDLFGPFSKLLGMPRPRNFEQGGGIFRKLGFNQYVCLYGALSLSVAMFLGTVVDKNLQAVFGSATSLMTVGRNGVRIGWLASGCLFGWLLWGLGGF